LARVVYGYRDDGAQTMLSRWKPRRVFCTSQPDHSDEPGNLYVVKFLQNQAGAAALISELICTSLYTLAGIRTLDSAIVHVSQAFADSYLTKVEIPYQILMGDHFGTVHRSDVETAQTLTYDQLAAPSEILRLWVFDTLVNNVDRDIYGNVLLSLTGANTQQFSVIASDQSDCFCGAGVFCSEEFIRTMRRRGQARSVSFLPTVIFNSGGATAIRTEIANARDSLEHIPDILREVPTRWWDISRIAPNDIQDVLEFRARRLEAILNPDAWEDIDVRGAKLL